MLPAPAATEAPSAWVVAVVDGEEDAGGNEIKIC